MSRTVFIYSCKDGLVEYLLMMNGILLNAGYPAINLPAKRQLEFNQLMLSFYQSGNQQPMNQFMRSCLDELIIEIMQE